MQRVSPLLFTTLTIIIAVTGCAVDSGDETDNAAAATNNRDVPSDQLDDADQADASNVGELPAIADLGGCKLTAKPPAVFNLFGARVSDEGLIECQPGRMLDVILKLQKLQPDNTWLTVNYWHTSDWVARTLFTDNRMCGATGMGDGFYRTKLRAHNPENGNVEVAYATALINCP